MTKEETKALSDYFNSQVTLPPILRDVAVRLKEELHPTVKVEKETLIKKIVKKVTKK